MPCTDFAVGFMGTSYSVGPLHNTSLQMNHRLSWSL
jgi:hypothetical protein